MNAQLYKQTNYRRAFDDLFHAERERRPGWSTAQLAEKIHVQPSHLTNVVKERSHFSSDQIHAIGTELGLNDEEISYLDLLMEWERAALPSRKSKLHAAIQSIRDRKLRAQEELKAKPPELNAEQSESYYLDPNVELMHLYLGTKDALQDTSEIAQLWGLSPDYVADLLKLLQNTGLIEQKRNRWHVKPIHQLLPPTSPLCKPQQMLKRLRVIDKLQQLPATRVYAFSATLTMNEETRLFIQARFVEFLKDVEKAVLESPSETIYHFQFDLFPWLEPKKMKR